MLTKSQFLDRLSRAVANTRKKIEPVSQSPTLVASDRTKLARYWAEDMEIWIEDSTHKGWLDNPVVQAIEVLSTVATDVPQSPEGLLYQSSTIEAAWEYYFRKMAMNVPFLYWDHAGRRFHFCDHPGDWGDHEFLIFPRD